MEQEGNVSKPNNGVFSKRIRAGRRRTYFFDVRTTKSNDYYLTITESKKRYNEDGYDRHKLFLYKEDFNKFVDALQETVDHVKSELLPEYDFDEFSRKDDDYRSDHASKPVEGAAESSSEEMVQEPVTDEKEADKNAEEKKEESAEEPTTPTDEKVEEPVAEAVKESVKSKEGDKEAKSDDQKEKEEKVDDINEEELKWD